MKNLEVGWIKDEAVNVDVTCVNPDSNLPACSSASQSAPPENLIVITCSGGVLRHWPARSGNSIW